MGTRRDGHSGRRNTVRLWSSRNESRIKGWCPSPKPYHLIILIGKQQCTKINGKEKSEFPLFRSDKIRGFFQNFSMFKVNLQVLVASIRCFLKMTSRLFLTKIYKLIGFLFIKSKIRISISSLFQLFLPVIVIVSKLTLTTHGPCYQ